MVHVHVAGLPMLQGHSIRKCDRHTFINVLQVVMLHGISTIRVEIVDFVAVTCSLIDRFSLVKHEF